MKQLSKYPHLRWYLSNLRSIPAGTYRFAARPSNKTVGTQRTMTAFRMGATPVTWGMWKEYLQSSSVPGKGIKLPDNPGWGFPDDHPVVNISWDEIMNPGGFCEWASGLAGFNLTLPTDGQWEYAARGGKDGLEYPWGNDFDRSKLWCSPKEYGGLNRIYRDDDGRTAAVDRSTWIYRNGYGLTDMVGNVWQWCVDYQLDEYRPVGKDPVDSKPNGYRWVRGGSWVNVIPVYFRCAYRSWRNPDYRGNDFGFRLVAPPK